VDTVKRENKLNIVNYKAIYTAKNSVLGADDRAGVYAIYKIMQSVSQSKMPNVLLTNYEEIGSMGMRFFTDNYKKMENIRLCIALDRQGCNDFVYYNDIHDKVKSYVKLFGFHEQYGTYSDCQDFTDAYRIPSVNLSVGYYGQHTKSEIWVTDETMLTVKRVISMINNPIPKLYKAKPKVIYYPYDDYKWDGNKYNKKKYRYYPEKSYADYCDWCGNNEATIYTNTDYGYLSLCGVCADDAGVITKL
jgi:hypothetical protein